MDLDIVRLLEIIHGTEILQRVLFDRDQRMLMKFQQRKVIHSDSDDQTEQEYDERIFRDFLKVASIKDSHNNLMQGRLINMFMEYKERDPLKSLDRRLLTGVWVKNLQKIEMAASDQNGLSNSLKLLKNGIKRAGLVLKNRNN